ncbi:hypothetical protein THASP1DRAFT_28459 [Thamnocephalis sphaerospora]|uniref:Uncharacterized protein n=1 Tax=Thamnocephalis sphaerospora TaxID=78915 RepID=A0A4P9XU58_9FUNG|nr:hypothetical protein THASP1DRAFT_28459 [Thamnocephalis sphaerospora]|eukprot:RKP09747.1 hypothetical protein THASP1DRAFT_28459 [Thamnocephalis sphaerospora]
MSNPSDIPHPGRQLARTPLGTINAAHISGQADDVQSPSLLSVTNNKDAHRIPTGQQLARTPPRPSATDRAQPITRKLAQPGTPEAALVFSPRKQLKRTPPPQQAKVASEKLPPSSDKPVADDAGADPTPTAAQHVDVVMADAPATPPTKPVPPAAVTKRNAEEHANIFRSQNTLARTPPQVVSVPNTSEEPMLHSDGAGTETRMGDSGENVATPVVAKHTAKPLQARLHLTEDVSAAAVFSPRRNLARTPPKCARPASPIVCAPAPAEKNAEHTEQVVQEHAADDQNNKESVQTLQQPLAPVLPNASESPICSGIASAAVASAALQALGNLNEADAEFLRHREAANRFTALKPQVLKLQQELVELEKKESMLRDIKDHAELEQTFPFHERDELLQMIQTVDWSGTPSEEAAAMITDLTEDTLVQRVELLADLLARQCVANEQQVDELKLQVEQQTERLGELEAKYAEQERARETEKQIQDAHQSEIEGSDDELDAMHHVECEAMDIDRALDDDTQLLSELEGHLLSLQQRLGRQEMSPQPQECDSPMPLLSSSPAQSSMPLLSRTPTPSSPHAQSPVPPPSPATLASSPAQAPDKVPLPANVPLTPAAAPEKPTTQSPIRTSPSPEPTTEQPHAQTPSPEPATEQLRAQAPSPVPALEQSPPSSPVCAPSPSVPAADQSPSSPVPACEPSVPTSAPTPKPSSLSPTIQTPVSPAQAVDLAVYVHYNDEWPVLQPQTPFVATRAKSSTLEALDRTTMHTLRHHSYTESHQLFKRLLRGNHRQPLLASHSPALPEAVATLDSIKEQTHG